jgi:hypothetical protein
VRRSIGKSPWRRNDPVPKLFLIGNMPARAWPAGSWRPLMWVLLLLPFVGLLWVPFYNSTEPSLFGFPFFYWYQFAWVPITSVLIWLVYRSQPHDEAE